MASASSRCLSEGEILHKPTFGAHPTVSGEPRRWIDAVVDAGLDRHCWLASPVEDAPGSDPVLRFRVFAQARLRRFNGVAHHVFGLHLQECVFRFNHQGEALDELLLGRLRAEPLRAAQAWPEQAHGEVGYSNGSAMEIIRMNASDESAMAAIGAEIGGEPRARTVGGLPGMA